MNPIALVLAQLAAAAQPVLPILAFPEPGLDDPAAYQGYQTRFFRDAAGNTVQVYIAGTDGRVVHLWADADNASAGLTIRRADGTPAPLQWGGAGAVASGSAARRTLEYRIVADAPQIHLGWFLLGSMRVERDLQYAGRHRTAFDGAPFIVPELDRLIAALERLPAAERRRHLAALGARDTRVLRDRLAPVIRTDPRPGEWVARAIQPALDGRDSMAIEIRVDPREVVASRAGDSLSLRARAGNRVPLTIRVTTSGATLTPLAREQIFSPAFLAFLDSARTAGDTTAGADRAAALRYRWLERQVRGVELLSSREKLMAGLPAYATYFGRDMLVSALMMRSIWRDEMSELVIASVLRKLSPTGQVSHEEALGGQAVREASAEYAALIEAHLAAAARGDRPAADSLLARARQVIGDVRRVRENYHMIDDEFQLPILAARWLGDPRVAAARKRAFLADASDGAPRLDRLLRALALLTRLSAPYAAEPVVTNLVSFPPREGGRWYAASWRDSNAGYAAGRFAMDVNVIWVPHALESIGGILDALGSLGFDADSLARLAPDAMTATALGAYVRDPASLRRAADTWRGASRHFLVRLGPSEVRSRVAARLAALPEGERRHWMEVLDTTRADRDSLEFLALALDAAGRPLAVLSTDPATRLFLDASANPRAARAADASHVARDVRHFVLPYPAGLFIEGVGPVVANDAYASPDVWAEFERDRYHGPRVVWGREVNLFLLGVAQRLAVLQADTAARVVPGADAAHARALRAALDRVLAAVEASGFQSELWSYELRDGRIVPVRYGTGSDVQLWSTTDLAVQFALSRLRP